MRALVKSFEPNLVINFLPKMQVVMMLETFGLKLKKVETVRVSPWEACQGNKIVKKLWNFCFRRSYKTILQTSEQGECFSKNIQKNTLLFLIQ